MSQDNSDFNINSLESIFIAQTGVNRLIETIRQLQTSVSDAGRKLQEVQRSLREAERDLL